MEFKSEFKTQVEPRQLAFWPFRNELYVGFSNGCVSVFLVNNLEKGPICKLYDLTLDTAIEHEKDIRVTRYEEKLDMIVTCSQDKFTNFWQPPKSWHSNQPDAEEDDEEVQEKGGDSSSDDGYGKLGKAKSSSDSDSSDSEDEEVAKRKAARREAKRAEQKVKAKEALAKLQQEDSDSDSDLGDLKKQKKKKPKKENTESKKKSP